MLEPLAGKLARAVLRGGRAVKPLPTRRNWQQKLPTAFSRAVPVESSLRSDSTGTATARLLCAPRLCPVSPNLPTGVGRTPQNKGETLIPKTPKIEKNRLRRAFFPISSALERRLAVAVVPHYEKSKMKFQSYIE
ncbi:MAG: hypothetical protein AAF960_25855 [Bacteroidota bacterium]